MSNQPRQQNDLSRVSNAGLIEPHLEVFFKDNLVRLREASYARMLNTSRHMAKKILKSYVAADFLKETPYEDGVYDRNIYTVNPQSPFRDYNITYWKNRLEESGLIDYLHTRLGNGPLALYGTVVDCTLGTNSPIQLMSSGNYAELDTKPFISKLQHVVRVESISPYKFIRKPNYVPLNFKE